jgi:hypothetical protein
MSEGSLVDDIYHTMDPETRKMQKVILNLILSPRHTNSVILEFPYLPINQREISNSSHPTHSKPFVHG